MTEPRLDRATLEVVLHEIREYIYVEEDISYWSTRTAEMVKASVIDTIEYLIETTDPGR